MQEEGHVIQPLFYLKGMVLREPKYCLLNLGSSSQEGFFLFLFLFLGGGGDKRENSNGKQYFQSAPFK